MKNLKKIAPILILILTFFISGCYTQLAVREGTSDDLDIVTNDEPIIDDQYYNNIDDTINTNNEYYYDTDDPDSRYSFSLSLGYHYPGYSNFYYHSYPIFTFSNNYGYYDPYYCWDPYSVFCYPNNYYYYPSSYHGYSSVYYNNYYGYNNYGYYNGNYKYRYRTNTGYKLRNHSGLRGKT
ncbi:MAG: hypothetical protein IIB83_04825 [Bacteroidetes bacterium]|nr:hypothetical protein [Bacteroidota bacterium]